MYSLGWASARDTTHGGQAQWQWRQHPLTLIWAPLVGLCHSLVSTLCAFLTDLTDS